MHVCLKIFSRTKEELFKPVEYTFDYSSNATDDETSYEDYIKLFYAAEYEEEDDEWYSPSNNCDYSQASSNGWSLFVKTNFVFGFVIPVSVSDLPNLLTVCLIFYQKGKRQAFKKLSKF